MRFQVVAILARRARRAKLCLASVALAAALSVAVGGDFARAETLSQALAATYLTNPTLNAERARLRAIDEEISQARSNFRPSVSGSLDTDFENTNTSPNSSTRRGGRNNYPKGYSVTLSKSLFRGFRTLNAIREADATINAGREDLRLIEQTALLDAVTAYMDVLRDRAIVRLREGNVRVLAEQLKATKDRFEVGEVTRTDVAQAEAARSGAMSQLSLAQSNLKTSRAAYQRTVGHPPSNLVEPSPIESLLPNVLASALQTAEAENPSIQSAVYNEEASRYIVKQIIGEMLPGVSLEATYDKHLDPSVGTDSVEQTTVMGKVTVPLYSKGEPSSRARQARETNRQRLRQIEEARAQTNADVIAAWGQLAATRAQIKSDQEQVRANNIALNGVREEEKVGQRTILDVLDAEQAYLDSQVALVGTKRDRVVAAFNLLSAIGRMNAANLRLPVELYNPLEHYDRIKHLWFGTNPDRRGLFRR